MKTEAFRDRRPASLDDQGFHHPQGNMRRLVGSVPDHAQKYVRATRCQIDDQARTRRLTRFSEYDADRTTLRHPLF